MRYRSEDIYHSVKKSDIKKSKLKKINQELLQSKQMQEYFKENPHEKLKVIKAIEENSIKRVKPSASYIPSYLIHDEQSNEISHAIEKKYGGKGKRSSKRRGKGKMAKLLEEQDKEKEETIV